MYKLQTILSTPYPLEERRTAQLQLAVVFGAVVFLFLLVVNPFSSTASYATILLNCGIAGLLTSVIIAADFFIFFRLFPYYFIEKKWTIGRELVWTLIIITTIATANIAADSIFWSGSFSIINWLRMIFYTAIIGIAPATASILINQARLLRKYRQEVKTINATIEEPVAIQQKVNESGNEPIHLTASPLTITAGNEKENLTVSAADFLAATSADNYVKIFYRKDEKLATAVLRTTLKKVEENSILFPGFFRCHRTALVNLAAVKNVSGSAQGYHLQIDLLSDEIPVSRSLNQVIKEKLAAIHP